MLLGLGHSIRYFANVYAPFCKKLWDFDIHQLLYMIYLHKILCLNVMCNILHDIMHQPSPCGSGTGVWVSISTQWLAFGQSAGDPWWSGRHYAAGRWQTQGENWWKRWALQPRLKGLIKYDKVQVSLTETWGACKKPTKFSHWMEVQRTHSQDMRERSLGTILIPLWRKELRKILERLSGYSTTVWIFISDILCRLTLAVFNYAEVEAAFVWFVQQHISSTFGSSHILPGMATTGTDSSIGGAQWNGNSGSTLRLGRNRKLHMCGKVRHHILTGFLVEDAAELFFGVLLGENEANRWKYGWTRDCFTPACQWPLCGRRNRREMGTPKERTQAATCRRLGAQRASTENFKGNSSFDTIWRYICPMPIYAFHMPIFKKEAFGGHFVVLFEAMGNKSKQYCKQPTNSFESVWIRAWVVNVAWSCKYTENDVFFRYLYSYTSATAMSNSRTQHHTCKYSMPHIYI